MLGALNLLELYELLRQGLRQAQGQPRAVADAQNNVSVLGRVTVGGGVVEVDDECADILESLDDSVVGSLFLELPDHEDGVGVRAGGYLL